MSEPATRRRPRLGTLSALQVLFVVPTFFAINFLSSQHYRPVDLSDNLGFTLAGSTRRYLASETVQSRSEPIEMIVAFRADSPFYEKIRPLAEEYVRLADGAIRLRMVDPIRASDVAESVAAEYGLIFNQDMVIIDARRGDERAGSAPASAHVHVARLEDMLVFENDAATQQRKVRAFLGEDALRAGLVAAIEGRRRKMWILADKSDLDSQANDGVWTVLTANLLSQNIAPERVQFATIDQVPEDVEAIAVIDAAYDFTGEEMAVLEAYWRRPGASLLLTFGQHDPPRRLRAFLREHGVTPRREQVVTMDDDLVRTTVLSRFTKGMPFMRDLWEKSTLLEGPNRMLEIREGAEDLLIRRVQPFRLLESDDAFWAETRYPAERVDFDPEEDRPGPVALGAAVIRGNPSTEAGQASASRMIVLGNSAFLIPANARKVNLDFLASSVNWLIGRPQLSGESARNLRLYRLPLLQPQIEYVNRVNLLLVPSLLLLIGASIWSTRRT
jgi:hypothetical protein